MILRDERQPCGCFSEGKVMETVFLLCAVIGGTIMVLQFALTVLGIGGHHGDGSDFGSAGADMSGHGAADLGSGHGLAVGDGHLAADHHAAASHDATHDTTSDRRGTVWFFMVVTFQALVAAIAFFGVSGRAALAADVAPSKAALIAIAMGLAAMYCVYYLVRMLHAFNADGTVRIEGALGQVATVYIPIPAANAGAGKIQMNLQNRVIEFEAMTAQDRLPCGAKVTIVGLLGPDTVAVERLIESEVPSHV